MEADLAWKSALGKHVWLGPWCSRCSDNCSGWYRSYCTTSAVTDQQQRPWFSPAATSLQLYRPLQLLPSIREWNALSMDQLQFHAVEAFKAHFQRHLTFSPCCFLRRMRCVFDCCALVLSVEDSRIFHNEFQGWACVDAAPLSSRRADVCSAALTSRGRGKIVAVVDAPRSALVNKPTIFRLNEISALHFNRPSRTPPNVSTYSSRFGGHAYTRDP